LGFGIFAVIGFSKHYRIRQKRFLSNDLFSEGGKRMDIAYVGDSDFLEPCERTSRQEKAALSAGQTIRIDLNAEKPGYHGRVVVEIIAGDGSGFGSDFEASDSTRFPARIRAAATALYNCGFSGRFLIAHREGVLEITQH
jgi:hypothetical protein